jgi:hypothetical protein
MASIEDVKHLTADQLELFYTCEELIGFCKEAREKFATLTKNSSELSKSGGSTSAWLDGVGSILGLAGLGLGLPTMLLFAPLDVLSFGAGTASVILGTYLLGHRVLDKFGKRQGAKNLEISANKYADFMSLCKQAKIKKNC